MALFVIERSFADQLDLDQEQLTAMDEYTQKVELRWLFSFLTTDRKKTYCLYEAPDPDALRDHAEHLGLPADSILEVTELNPEMFTGTSATGHNASL